MNNRRLLYLTLLIATLTIGVVIGTIVSGGVKATAEQKAATLVIPDPVSLSNAFSQIAAQLEPSVVNITVETRVQTTQRRGSGRNAPTNPFDFFDFFGAPDNAPNGGRRAFAEGSGVIVDKAGYILTNHHVVENANKIRVRLDDKSEHQAKLIGSDEETDLAVIKIDPGRDLPYAKLGNSDAVKVGDWVLALGSPFGLDHTVTSGIISAKGRESREISPGSPRQFQSFLQTDAAINRGNSGGPLVSMGGEVIGVNTAILSETGTFAGLGFAIPSNTAIRVYNQLVQSGKVTRGSIGISYDDDPAILRAMGLKAGDGVIVNSVTPGGPASKSGLHAGDVIVAIDGKRISNGPELLDTVANLPVGRTIQLKLNRDGKEVTVPLTIEDRASVFPELSGNARPERERDQAETAQGRLGIRVQDITPDMVRSMQLESSDGVYIASVDPDSPAEDAGLVPGLIIRQVRAGMQRMDITNVEDFRRAERLMKSGSDVALMIMQRNPATNRWTSGFRAVTIP